MNKMLLSIIIPVYNVEPWLRECLNSVCAIPCDDWEAIIVDDGSLDASGRILDNYSNDSRLTIIHTPHKGVSCARNEAFKHASGDYIAFLDGDDYLDPEETARMIDRLRDDDDIVTGSYRIIFDGDNDARPDRRHTFKNGLRSNGRDFILNHYISASAVIWRSFYRRNLIIPFHEGVRFEDVEWSIQVYRSATSIVCIDVPFYYYRRRKGSITSSKVDAATLADACAVCDTMMLKAADLQNDKAIARMYERNALHLAIHTAFSAFKTISRDERRKFRSFLQGKKTSGLRYTVILAISKFIFSF